jgi:3-deoxy-manno-octulosonate cytidylyltransferase (CMP-KDO synthetase)
MIDAAVAPFAADDAVQCVNLTKRIETEAEFRDPNTIKVVMDENDNAICFSREPIPTARLRGFDAIEAHKQVCIIPFRAASLALYAKLPQTPGEKAESVDMMRFLEHGIRVRMVKTGHDTFAVDTPADLARVEKLLAGDPLVKRY